MKYIRTYEAFSLNPKKWFKKKEEDKVEVLADTDNAKKKDVDLSTVEVEVGDFIYGLADLSSDKYTTIINDKFISYAFYLDDLESDLKDEIAEIKERIESLDENLTFNSVTTVKRQFADINEYMRIVLIVVSNGYEGINRVLKEHILKSRGELGLRFEDPYKNQKRRTNF